MSTLDPALVRIPAGELRAKREYLGLTLDELADALDVSKGVVADWESGRKPIPYRVGDEVAELEVVTDQAVAEVMARLLRAPSEERHIVVFRSQGEMSAAMPEPSWASCRWWRHVARRAALGVPGTRIVTAAESPPSKASER